MAAALVEAGEHALALPAQDEIGAAPFARQSDQAGLERRRGHPALGHARAISPLFHAA